MPNSTTLEAAIVEPEQTTNASIIWLHGLGADGYDFVDLVPELNFSKNLNIRFIFPHAPIRPITINGGIPMRAWFDIYSLSDISKEDEQNIRASQQALINLIDKEIAKGISSKNIIVAGFSQGAAIALFTGLRYPKTLAGILALSTYLPIPNSLNAEAQSANKNTPIFLAHGEYDDILPIQLANNTRKLLTQNDYSVEWHCYDMAHQVCPEEILALNKWINECLSVEVS